jgi:hypothetical protein
MDIFDGYSPFLVKFAFEFEFFHFCMLLLMCIVPYKVLIVFGEFRVSLSFGVQPCIHKVCNSCYFHLFC